MSAAEVDALLDRCALVARSGWGRLRATGKDFLDLVHRLSTGDVKDLPAGTVGETVLTTAKGRIVARLVLARPDDRETLVLCGALEAARVEAHLRKYTFAEQTGIVDVTGSTAEFAILGPEAAPLVRPLEARRIEIGGASAVAIGHGGFDAEGVTVVAEAAAAAAVEGALREAAGGRVAGPEAFEAWRILRGYPAAGSELNEDHNPLEAGLRAAVSFTKGCYVGQEVVARLNTYDKVSRSLVRVILPEGAPVPAPGSPVTAGGKEVGAVTSAALPPGRTGPVALAYVKTREIGAGPLDVVAGGAAVRVEAR